MNWDRARQIARWLVLLWAAVGFWLSMSGYRHLAWGFVLLVPLTIMFASLGGFHTQKELATFRRKYRASWCLFVNFCLVVRC